MVLISLVSLFVFWSPFILKLEQLWGIEFKKQGMNVIVQNFDGLNFLVVAKSWYSPDVITQINSQFLTGNDPIYFTAHFPGFAFVTGILGTFLPLPYALLLAILLSNILMAAALYWFFEYFTKNPRLSMFMACAGMFSPARMLSVRAVGSNEPLFIFFVLLSLLLALKKRYWSSAILGSAAVITRSPGIILFVVYAWEWLMDKDDWAVKTRKYLPYLMMPLTLLILFGYYGWIFNDLLAYFHSGDNLHLFFPPFQIFSNMTTWINDMWREDVIYLYLFYGTGLAMIDTKWKVIRNWGLVYGATLLFVAHRDIARYALPIAPIALLGYVPLLEKVPRQYWYVLGALIIPIYLLGWQFVLKNIQPINDWGVFL